MKDDILECKTIAEVEELKNHEDVEVRIDAYYALGFTENDFNNKEALIRWRAYKLLGFTEKAFEDTDNEIRLGAYEQLGFTEKSLNDKFWVIRLKAYRQLGFTENAFKDEADQIRWEAYQKLGFTEESLKDTCSAIKRQAQDYFHVKKLFDMPNTISPEFNIDDTVFYRCHYVFINEDRHKSHHESKIDECIVKDILSDENESYIYLLKSINNDVFYKAQEDEIFKTFEETKI